MIVQLEVQLETLRDLHAHLVNTLAQAPPPDCERLAVFMEGCSEVLAQIDRVLGHAMRLRPRARATNQS